MRKLCAVSVALLFSLRLAQGNTFDNWKRFKASNGFSVKYPGSWFRKDNSADRLTILSSHGGTEAVLIKQNQAILSVMEEKTYKEANLPMLVDHYTQGVSVIARESIRNMSAGSTGCGDLLKVVSREPVVPPEDVPHRVPFIVNTEFFCDISGHKYVTVLRNFEGDPKQPLYQRIALGVAESIVREQ